ncbi:hypothetical protein BH09PAT4_BH09PAT4_00670 [soil metagenome]
MTPDQTEPKNDNPYDSTPASMPTSFGEPNRQTTPDITPEPAGSAVEVPNTEPNITTPTPVSPVVSIEPAEPTPTPPTPGPAPTPAPVVSSPSIEPTSAMPTAAVGSPVVGTEVTSGSNMAAPMTATVGHHGPRFGGKKRIFAAGLAVFLLLSLGAGYVFAFYIPNKPENVWKTSLVNTGKAYDMLSEYATKNKDAKGVKIEGSYKLKGSFVSDGSLSGQSVGQDGQVSGSFSAVGLKLGFDLRTFKSSGETPDLYFKLTGLQGLGGLLGGANAEMTSVINSINNQWFLVDHSLFEQFNTSASKTQFTKADADNFLKAVGNPSKEYLFTADSDKAVLVLKDTIGSEKKDGRNTYHYKVAYDNAHLGAYLNALCTSLNKDKIGKLVASGQLGDCKELARKATNTKNAETADVWVDKHTKLVHVVRFSDPKDANNYLEVGQDYQGGDTIPFSLKVNSKQGNTTTTANVTGTLNTKANTFAIEGEFNMGGSQGENGTFSLKITPSNETTLKVDKPANAKTIIQLLNSLGLGSVLGSATTSGSGSTVGTYTGVQAKARDSQRQADINSLQMRLEAYYAENGFYPTISQLNSASWRATNMAGLDTEALKDPQGASAVLVGRPAAHSYAYQGGNCTNTKCSSYKVTATLETAGKYTKTSL